MTTKQTIEVYFDGLNQKNGWENQIADDMVFDGPKTHTRGKEAYIQATSSFLKVVQSVEVSKFIVDGSQACTVAHYTLVSPSGKTGRIDLAELFKVNNGQIESSAIFFDTAAFREFIARG